MGSSESKMQKVDKNEKKSKKSKKSKEQQKQLPAPPEIPIVLSSSSSIEIPIKNSSSIESIDSTSTEPGEVGHNLLLIKADVHNQKELIPVLDIKPNNTVMNGNNSLLTVAAELDDIFKHNTNMALTQSQPKLITDLIKYNLTDLFTNASAPELNSIKSSDPFASIIELDRNKKIDKTFSFIASEDLKSEMKKSSATNLNQIGFNNNEFEDLLVGFQRHIPVAKPRKKTVAELREEISQKSENSINIKISKWTDNRENNIRTLLSTLDTIVWKGCNFQKIGLEKLITNEDVKKMYHKACLIIHPDKQIGNSNEELAKLIFIELHEAWCKYEQELH